MREIELWILIESDLAELALPSLCVVSAVFADAARHVSGGRVHERVEETRAGVIVAVAL